MWHSTDDSLIRIILVNDEVHDLDFRGQQIARDHIWNILQSFLQGWESILDQINISINTLSIIMSVQDFGLLKV